MDTIFNVRYWDGNGGRSDRRPVHWESGHALSEKQLHLFVSADWFPDWQQWSVEAQRAIDSTLFRFDAFDGTFIKSGTSFPIAESPHFYVEKSELWQGGYSIWINALCPTEAEFVRTVAEAKERIAQYAAAAAELRVAEALPILPVSSADFQDAPRASFDL